MTSSSLTRNCQIKQIIKSWPNFICDLSIYICIKIPQQFQKFSIRPLLVFAPTWVEFLFQVVLGIGMIFQVGTLYSRVSLWIIGLLSLKLRRHGGKIRFVSILFVGWLLEIYKSKVASKLQQGRNWSKQCLVILFLLWFWIAETFYSVCFLAVSLVTALFMSEKY